jgi:hypothetical protein
MWSSVRPHGGEARFATLQTAICPSQSLDVGGMSPAGRPTDDMAYERIQQRSDYGAVPRVPIFAT